MDPGLLRLEGCLVGDGFVEEDDFLEVTAKLFGDFFQEELEVVGVYFLSGDRCTLTA